MSPPTKKSSSRSSSKKKARPTLPEHIKLTADRLIVSIPADGERRSKSGLLIPATAGPTLKRCVWADVIGVGPDTRTVKTGDSILFLPHVGLEVEIDGEELLLLRERDVQAVSSEPSGDGHEHRTPGQYL